MFNLKGILNESLYKNTTSDFYLLWLLYDLSPVLKHKSTRTLLLPQIVCPVIVHKPHFINSYTRLIHVELE